MDIRKLTTFVLSMWIGAAALSAAPAPDSKRLGRAKDYIADEQWSRAVAELKAVLANAKEPNRDEALFWLAHSEHQAGDQAAAIETIARLERDYPSSAWVRPARSLRIEIAQRLRRDDLLWWTAVPPAPPQMPAPPAMTPPPQFYKTDGRYSQTSYRRRTKCMGPTAVWFRNWPRGNTLEMSCRSSTVLCRRPA